MRSRPHGNQDPGQERHQASAERHAEKGHGGSVRPEQNAANDPADQSHN
jgi:hypothetical protein